MMTNLLRRLTLCVLMAACAASANDVPPVAGDIRQVPMAGRRNIRESSGLAMSRNEQGLLYTIEDSGNDAILYAFDTTGADRGTWTVANAANVDWEAIATARCGSQSCIYVGDVGDNRGMATEHRIYRIAEPRSPTDSIRAEVLRFTYPDGPHDVEAMYVTPGADILLVTKRPLQRGNRLRSALVYELPAIEWKDGGAVEARLVDSLPIVPGAKPLMLITDASLSPDGSMLAVRTYVEAYIFLVDSTNGRVNHDAKFSVCDVAPLGEAQGEGIAWLGANRLAFSSEGKGQPLRLASCPTPER